MKQFQTYNQIRDTEPLAKAEGIANLKGVSPQGINVRAAIVAGKHKMPEAKAAHIDQAKVKAQGSLQSLKQQPKPMLPKSEACKSLNQMKKEEDAKKNDPIVSGTKVESQKSGEIGNRAKADEVSLNPNVSHNETKKEFTEKKN